MELVDTNVLVRFLLDDNREQVARIRRWLSKAKPGGLWVTDVVLAEIVFVLGSVYCLSRDEIKEKIESLVNFPAFRTNKLIVLKTIELYSAGRIHFVDAYMLALVEVGKAEKVYSFDKKLGKVGGKKVREP